jgi:DNA-binding NtrC family response regulator
MKYPVKKECILVVDDVPDTLEVIQRNLTSKGFTVFTSTNVTDATKLLETTPIDLVITDYKMPASDGLELVRHIRENYKETEVIMITGYASVKGAVEAIKTGAEEYIMKPFTDEELISAVKKTLEKLKVRKIAHIQTPHTFTQYGFVGSSAPMKKVYRAISKASQTSATVLISGESGTGKELAARAIHYSSRRGSSQFVPVNCGGIPEGLLESELFGYVKGAFTGAVETRSGFFQTADGGTIFLDEISEMSIAMQVKLLRVLQDKQVYMVGSNRPQKADLRILAATNKDLVNLVEKGLFRNDLYYRLNVINIQMPPLRDRDDDILLLINHFTQKYCMELDKKVPHFSKNALKILQNYYWPGNVRELENIIQRLVIMVESEVIDVPDLPSLMRFSTLKGFKLNQTLEEMEYQYITNVLQSVKGNKSKASEILGIDRKTLREKIRKFSEKNNTN